MRRLYITGCAGTGTTLVQRLMSAFRGVDVVWGEVSLRSFVAYQGEIVVGKRIGSTIFSHVQRPGCEALHVALIEQHGIEIINVVRSGERFGYSDRWRSSMEQAQRLSRLIAYTVRYEDLIETPNAVQVDMAQRLALDIDARWGAYPAFVPAEAFAYIQDPRYRARPIGEAV